ncbi:sigma-70 family RNA polymerase sigma factor [candidate division KSB1 bacterium]|nr:sigma-70 family RNA polymerase sigma factor [candidate division KSB1 bacterium]
MTDQQLIEKFLSGNVQAFNTLVWRWQKPIINFSYRYVGELETAKEIAQETFIRVHQNLKRLQDQSKFSTWIYSIALNLCRDNMKRKKRIFVSLDDLRDENNTTLPEELWTEAADRPDENAHRSDLARRVQCAIQALPEEQRTVIIMKEYQGLKFTEIADILKIPINTAKSRMYNGLAALGKALAGMKITQEAL